MEIKYNPYSIFKNSNSPVSLYARKKWLNESDSDEWKNDYEKTVSKIMAKGLWDEEIIVVIQRLFDLHLTVRYKTPEIENTVLKLLKKADDILIKKDRKIITNTNGLPFTESESCFFIPPAALFLALIFDLTDNNIFKNIFESMLNLLRKTLLEKNNTVFIHNFFRVLAVNTLYAELPETEAVLDRLISTQTKQGDWNNGIPFYQAVNAAAHINSKKADTIFQRAFKSIVLSQNKDGSWGCDKNKEWNTFLLVHALKNKSII